MVVMGGHADQVRDGRRKLCLSEWPSPTRTRGYLKPVEVPPETRRAFSSTRQRGTANHDYAFAATPSEHTSCASDQLQSGNFSPATTYGLPDSFMTEPGSGKSDSSEFMPPTRVSSFTLDDAMPDSESFEGSTSEGTEEIYLHGGLYPVSETGQDNELFNDYYTPLRSPASSLPNSPSVRLRLHKQQSSGSSPGSNGNRGRLHKTMRKARNAVSHIKRRMRFDKARASFKWNVNLAMRIAIGVVIAGFAQTKDTTNPGKRYVFMPEEYYIGGLSYAANMLVFAASRNVGGALENIFQIVLGVNAALVYNLLFSYVIGDIKDNNLLEVATSWGTGRYFVSLHDWGIAMPFFFLFTLIVYILPLQNNVKIYAVSSNVYFMLTIVSPMNPIDPSQKRNEDNPLLNNSNLMVNFALYSLVGAIGTFIALCTVLFPTPLLAIKQLNAEMEEAQYDIRETLNLIVDSYCFRAKDIKEMDFFHIRLDRQLAAAQTRRMTMKRLLANCWWEEVVGIGYCTKFNKTVAKQFVGLYARLLKDLYSMKSAIEKETCHWTHITLMQKMQKKIYVLQVETNDLLEEISRRVLLDTREMPTDQFQHLERRVERLIAKYAEHYETLLSAQVRSPTDVGTSMPMNLFLYSFLALVRTLNDFETVYNRKNFSSRHRIGHFFKACGRGLFRTDTYSKHLMNFACRTTLATWIGVVCSTFLFSFRSNVPTAIIMIAQYNRGGTYSSTVNRLAGLFAGNVVPSICNFFLCKLDNIYTFMVLNNVTIFIWTVLCMYVFYSEGYMQTGGMVAAFMAITVLLDSSCSSNWDEDRANSKFDPNGDGTMANSNSGSGLDEAATCSSPYSSLTENSLGVLILLAVELLWSPQSATSILRENIQRVFRSGREIFSVTFQHHLASFAIHHSDKESGENEDQLGLLYDKHRREELRMQIYNELSVLVEQQEKLLRDASMEPTLWRAPFSETKYAQVLQASQSMLIHLRLLLDLADWHEKRKKSRQKAAFGSQRSTLNVHQHNHEHTDESETPLAMLKEAWITSHNVFKVSVEESLETLEELFGDEFAYANGQDSAIFMQVREAFRVADVHRRGVVDASELALLLEKLLPYGAHGNAGQLEQYVDEFMAAVDGDKDGKVSLNDIMRALNRGFRLELEIYDTVQPLSTSAVPISAPSSISRNMERMSSNISATGDGGAGPASFTAARLAELTENDEVPKNRPRRTSSVLSSPLLGANWFGKGNKVNRSKMPPRGGARGERRPGVEANDALLNVESFNIKSAAAKLKSDYSSFLLRQSCANCSDRNAVDMEEFIVMSCVICVADELASVLTTLNGLAAT